PVNEMTARAWINVGPRIKDCADAVKVYWPDGRAPRFGEIFRNVALARSLRIIADQGRDGYYLGELAEKIVQTSEANGGLFTIQDFAEHTSTWEEAITADYGGYRLYECPPNGQGIAALMALNIVRGFDIRSMGLLSADALHVQIEAMKIAFADAKE